MESTMKNTTLARIAHELAVSEINRKLFRSRIKMWITSLLFNGSRVAEKAKTSHLDKILLKAKLEERVKELGEGVRMKKESRVGEP